jgi:hypothetical protein
MPLRATDQKPWGLPPGVCVGPARTPLDLNGTAAAVQEPRASSTAGAASWRLGRPAPARFNSQPEHN